MSQPSAEPTVGPGESVRRCVEALKRYFGQMTYDEALECERYDVEELRVAFEAEFQTETGRAASPGLFGSLLRQCTLTRLTWRRRQALDAARVGLSYRSDEDDD